MILWPAECCSPSYGLFEVKKRHFYSFLRYPVWVSQAVCTGNGEGGHYSVEHRPVFSDLSQEDV